LIRNRFFHLHPKQAIFLHLTPSFQQQLIMLNIRVSDIAKMQSMRSFGIDISMLNIRPTLLILSADGVVQALQAGSFL